MNYIIGRLAVELNELGLAHESFQQLLIHQSRLASPQQQSLYLQEFLLAMKVCCEIFEQFHADFSVVCIYKHTKQM